MLLKKCNFSVAVIGCLSVLLLSQGPIVFAHHSYSPIDKTRLAEVSAIVAKLEWTNPHIFLWTYVVDESQESGYQLWAFETGSITMMARAGWSRDDTLKVGEKVTIEYFPLRDGRPGGEIASLTHADGTVTLGDSPPLNWRRQIREGTNGEAQ